MSLCTFTDKNLLNLLARLDSLYNGTDAKNDITIAHIFDYLSAKIRKITIFAFDMRRLLIFTIFLTLIVSCQSSSGNRVSGSDGVCIVGASFAYSENGWFEMACEMSGKEAINRAVSGTNIITTAMDMYENRLFTVAEHDSFETFVIMHTHNVDVCTLHGNNYTVSVNMSYAEGFDYVLSRYISECKALELNPKSKWYGVEGGKRVDIILCTHWHDARTEYNNSVRRLAQRWGSDVRLCEFDTQIGFSKNSPDSITGEQISLLYAHDDNGKIEVIDGVEYGWHPKRGRESVIQQRMAKIFATYLTE